MDEPLLTTRDVARLLGCSAEYVRQLARAGLLIPLRLVSVETLETESRRRRQHYRFSHDAVAAYLRRCGQKAALPQGPTERECLEEYEAVTARRALRRRRASARR